MGGFRIDRQFANYTRPRRPRVVSNAHLAFIRKLPCVISGTRPVDPAHLRSGNRLLGKSAAGLSEKPDDRWVTPLSRRFHDEQHSMNELAFWRSHNIDNPFALALALYAASIADDMELAEAIVAEHQLLAMGIST